MDVDVGGQIYQVLLGAFVVINNSNPFGLFGHLQQHRALVREVDDDDLSAGHVWWRLLVNARVEVNITIVCLPDDPCRSEAVDAISMVNA